MEAPGDQITCGSCPPGMVGNGLFCKTPCSPPCNGHQKCSKQFCSKGNDYESFNDKRIVNPKESFELTKYTSLGKRGPRYSIDKIETNSDINNDYISNKTVKSDNVMIKKTLKSLKCVRSCRNGGVCVGNNKCSCPAAWRGKSCNKRKYY